LRISAQVSDGQASLSGPAEPQRAGVESVRRWRLWNAAGVGLTGVAHVVWRGVRVGPSQGMPEVAGTDRRVSSGAMDFMLGRKRHEKEGMGDGQVSVAMYRG